MENLQTSRRDNTLLTVGFSIRIERYTPVQVPQGRHFLLRHIQVSSLRDWGVVGDTLSVG
ncbi:MAG: hypothetical protein LBQ70_06675 [Prevotellaceae bacterium]|nr:hypothetical protein [Prevotellaceae bacterium]